MKFIPILTLALSTIAIAQPPQRGGSGRRNHTETEAKPFDLYPATEEAPTQNAVSITIIGDKRVITANGMPDHKMGKFPNAGNPNTPTVQDFRIELPLKPEVSAEARPARKAVGILTNGILLEGGTGEFWYGEGEGRGWNYNALGGALDFGLDSNHAHVQPTGKYHYHGIPTGFLEEHEVSGKAHSPIIGWAFDGFPIYALYGYEDGKDANSKIIKHTSSYKLKEGSRPAQPEGPGGTYDGAFNEDFEYVEGHGTLDECNGCFTITPEFPEGTYAYFMTNEWPSIHNKYRGTPTMEDKPKAEPAR